MDRAATGYISAVVLIAVWFVIAHFPSADFLALTRGDWEIAVAFIAVGLLSQAQAIDFGKGRQASSSVAFIPFLTTAIVFPPVVSLIVVATVIGISEFAFVRRGLLKGSFNVAQLVLALGLGAHVYTRLAPPLSRLDVFLPGFVALVVIFFSTNILLSSIGLALYRRQSFLPTLTDVVGPRGGNFIWDIVVSPSVLAAVWLYAHYEYIGVLGLMLPLLFIRRFYQAERKLQDANTDLLTVLVKAIETRDPYTSGHSIRVSTLSTLIAEDMRLSWRRIAKTRKAALLHDIGKIDPIYADVLAKPYDLTAAERDLIQTHAARGADLLLGLNSVDAEIVSSVRHHHERYDGLGYPAGLAGDAIPMAARIIMISDSIDAMLSDRPYRSALSLNQVKSELQRCAGTQFDPKIVAVVLRASTLEKALVLVDEWRATAFQRAEEQASLLRQFDRSPYLPSDFSAKASSPSRHTSAI